MYAVKRLSDTNGICMNTWLSPGHEQEENIVVHKMLPRGRSHLLFALYLRRRRTVWSAQAAIVDGRFSRPSDAARSAASLSSCPPGTLCALLLLSCNSRRTSRGGSSTMEMNYGSALI